ncbi:MAG: GTPase Era [Bacteroidota bacterium]
MQTKSGYVAIVGLPNVGKSTLMNALLGEKLSIVTNKPQTTRKRILGILSSEWYQIIFLDTPGILQPGYLLQEKMLDNIELAIKDSNIILFLIDIASDSIGEKTFADKNVSRILKKSNAAKILIINKVDLSSQQIVEKAIEIINAKNIFDRIVPVSAANKFNIESIIDSILEFLPESPKYYPDDDLSDANERFFVSEIIREQIFEQYRDEIPYSCEVLIEEFKVRVKGKDFIRAQIIVEKESQKPIIIGNKGASIKKLGKTARQAVEAFLGREVFLELFVKVREKWRSNPKLLKNFGYSVKDE